jgi:membrane-bound serine protease (ClpP class)
LETLLTLVSDPNIAYLLFLAGLLGLGFELFHPGAIVPGVVGLIGMLLALYAATTLPLNLAGLLLLVAGLILFALDLKAPTHGVLTAGGAVALGVGAYILVDSPGAAGGLSLLTIGASLVLLLGMMVAVLPRLLAARHRPLATGTQTLVGELGVLQEAAGPDHDGLVQLHGELWRAQASVPLEAGSTVRVSAVNGLRLSVDSAQDSVEGSRTAPSGAVQA